MSHWQGLFVHRPDFGIIICRKCEYAVVPQQIERHVKDHHPFTSKQQRTSIVQSINELSDIAKAHADVAYPVADQSPVVGLPIFVDGMQCTECMYVCRSPQGIKKHCKVQHGWVNSQRRGGQTKKKEKHSRNRMWIVGVACQRFFEYRQWQRLFSVRVEQTPSTPGNEETAAERAKSVKSSVETARTAKHKERRIQGNAHRCVAHPWLDFVGWHRHLAGFPVKQLVQLVWPAKDEAEFDESIHEAQAEWDEENEAALARACQATKRTIRYAFTISAVEHVGRAALEAVNRRELGLGSNEKPFYGKLKVQSLRKYMQVFIKMLRYIWRGVFPRRR